MRLRRLVCVLAFLPWLACVSAAAFAQAAADEQAAWAKADRLLAEARAREGLLAQYAFMREAEARDRSATFRRAFGQYLSWYQSFVGDYPAALASFPIAQRALPDDSPSPLDTPGLSARPALEAIPQLARDRRIVLFNEAHHVPLTRSLTVQLLARLREEGFDYFAAETLDARDAGLATRGYPVDASGFYTEEPVYAEMVRTALKLGYEVVAYEAGANTPSGEPREAAQARNLYARVFAHDPRARLVVNAGYSHILKSGRHLGGRSMAEYLQQFSGLPMLAVEQTMLIPHAAAGDDHPTYTAVMRRIQPKAPIVFVDARDRPWSLRPGYDVSVFFPHSERVQGRPTWLRLGGLRRPFEVNGRVCRRRFPCLVEARYADEGADAIPADRLLLERPSSGLYRYSVPLYTGAQATPSGQLYLRPDKYRLTATAEDGSVVSAVEIVVRGPAN